MKVYYLCKTNSYKKIRFSLIANRNFYFYHIYVVIYD
jgi:hypothetical protein